MGEIMRILNEKLPRDVIQHCIQPYLMVSARTVMIGHYAVIKNLRKRVRKITIEKDKQAAYKREINFMRPTLLAHIRHKSGWVQCLKCNRVKKGHCTTPRHVFNMCRECYINTLKIEYVCEPSADRYLYFVQRIIKDKESGLVYAESEQFMQYIPDNKFKSIVKDDAKRIERIK